jgi:hypothetical protein
VILTVQLGFGWLWIIGRPVGFSCRAEMVNNQLAVLQFTLPEGCLSVRPE